MPPKAIEQEIQARVAAFAADLAGLIRQSAFDSLHQALGTPSAARAAAPAAAAAAAAPVARRGRGKGKRKAGGGAAAPAIAAYVAANPGSRLEHISKGLNKPSASLKAAVAALLGSGELKKTGQRRGTQYFVGDGTAPAPKAKVVAKKRATKRKAKRVTKTKTKSKSA